MTPCVLADSQPAAARALDEFVRRRIGHPENELSVRSWSLDVIGTSHELLVVHRIMSSRREFGSGDRPWWVVQKPTRRPTEAAAHAWVSERSSELAPGLCTPALYECMVVGGEQHLFMEYLSWFSPTPSAVSRRAYEVLVQSLVELNALDIAHHSAWGADLHSVDYSAVALGSELGEIHSSPLLDSVDADAQCALVAFSDRIEAVAEMAAQLPRLFCHNDAAMHNLMVHGDGAGGPGVVTLLDWGQAAWNLPGADLHHVVRDPALPGWLVEHCLTYYADAVQARLGAFQATDRRLGTVFGAYLYAFLRLQAMARIRADPVRLAHAMRLAGRVAQMLEPRGSRVADGAFRGVNESAARR